MKLIVDGIVFQNACEYGTDARFWATLIRELDERNDLILLDRGFAPQLRRGISVPFPAYCGGAGAEDSILLQKIGEHYGSDVFLSTGATTPLTIPTLVLNCGIAATGSAADRLENELALAYGQRMCVPTEAAKQALLAHSSDCAAEMIAVDRGQDATDLLLYGVETVLASHGCCRDPASLSWLPERASIVPLDSARAVDQMRQLGEAGRSALVLLDRPEALDLLITAFSFGIPVLSCARGTDPVPPGRGDRAGDVADYQSISLLADDGARGSQALTLRAGHAAAANEEHLRYRSAGSLATCIGDAAVLVLRQAREGRFDNFLRQWSSLRRLQARVDVPGFRILT